MLPTGSTVIPSGSNWVSVGARYELARSKECNSRPQTDCSPSGRRCFGIKARPREQMKHSLTFRFRVTAGTLTVHLLVSSFVSSLWAQSHGMYIYPSKGQSQEEQHKDRYHCHRWAVQETGLIQAT